MKSIIATENSITKSKECSVEGCGRDSKNSGYCWAHYYRVRRNGYAGVPQLLHAGGICSIEGCNRKVYGRHYCSMHYQRVVKHGDAGPPKRLIAEVIGDCAVEGCGNKANGGAGYCDMHYDRFKTYGDVGPVSRLKRKRGEGAVTNTGYVAVGDKEGSKHLMHRIIAEKAIGKPLPESAVIHHVDGNKSNNDPSNLVICPDDNYHKLLHRRQRALEVCGNADWKKCVYCKKYDDPIKMHVQPNLGHRAYHRECASKYARDQRKLNKFDAHSSCLQVIGF